MLVLVSVGEWKVEGSMCKWDMGVRGMEEEGRHLCCTHK